jgi:hypothetical protein
VIGDHDRASGSGGWVEVRGWVSRCGQEVDP